MPADSDVFTKEKTVFITGASSGFGLAACEVFLRKGWTVYAAVRGGMQRANLFMSIWDYYPHRLKVIELDLTDHDSIHNAAMILGNRPLDALINNAGYGVFGATEDMTEGAMRRQMEVNFFGTFRLTQILLPKLRESKGAIITVSSILGRHALPLTSAYCASKFAVEGWMESLAMELKPFKVNCYLVEPGTYPTKFSSGTDWAVPSVHSPYRDISRGYEAFRDKVYAKARRRSVKSVGEKFHELAERRPGGLRHPMGPDARATVFFARLLPANLLHRIATAVLNYLQRKHIPQH